jgi:hypothetical protein
MLEKKSLLANLSCNNLCSEITSEINHIVQKIRSGSANNNDIGLCNKLVTYLSNLLDNSKSIDSTDRWIARETIDMCEFIKTKYDSNYMNDKI